MKSMHTLHTNISSFIFHDQSEGEDEAALTSALQRLGGDLLGQLHELAVLLPAQVLLVLLGVLLRRALQDLLLGLNTTREGYR